jgi:putative ABC transport system permease protein
VSPTDPWTFIAVAALLAAASTVACYGAARRVVRIDPAAAMRTE